jgi:hypothetical protein
MHIIFALHPHCFRGFAVDGLIIFMERRFFVVGKNSVTYLMTYKYMKKATDISVETYYFFTDLTDN